VRSYRAFQYFDKCIDSILAQKNKNYTIIYIDDASGYSLKQKKYIKQKLHDHIVVFNRVRKYSLRNAYEAIHKYVKEDDAIIANIDGDDWLIRNDVIDVVDKTYQKYNCLLTYGNCIYYNPSNKNHQKKASSANAFTNVRYPKFVEKSNLFRLYHFPILHLRTWKANLFKRIPKDKFLRPNGEWIRYCEDMAMFFPMLEKSHGRYSVISEPLYSYNIQNPSNDFKIHTKEMLFDEVCIRRNNKQNKTQLDLKNQNVGFVKHSQFANMTKKGVVFNLLQIIFIRCGLTSSFYFPSYHKAPLIKRFINIVSSKFSIIFYNNFRNFYKTNIYLLNYTYKLGKTSLFNKPTVIDVVDGDIKINSKQAYQEIMWTLTISTHISKNTNKLLMKECGKNFEDIVSIINTKTCR